MRVRGGGGPCISPNQYSFSKSSSNVYGLTFTVVTFFVEKYHKIFDSHFFILYT
jgi:hypothetical protein